MPRFVIPGTQPAWLEKPGYRMNYLNGKENSADCQSFTNNDPSEEFLLFFCSNMEAGPVLWALTETMLRRALGLMSHSCHFEILSI